MTDKPEPANDMRELYAVQHAITDAGGELTPAVHKALDALRETWDRELRRAQAEVFQYRTALQGTARAAAPPPADRAAVLREAADDLAEFIALHGPTSRTVAGWRGAVGFLRRLSAEAQQPDTGTRVHTDRAAVLLEAAKVVDNPDGAFASNASDWGFIHARTEMAAKLRRMAAEAQPQSDTGEEPSAD